jgi:hypothetical protein
LSPETIHIVAGDSYDEEIIPVIEEFTNVEFEDLGKQ